MHPEVQIDGFTQHDAGVRFYGFVWACILRTGARRVLDFGAGRGAEHLAETAEAGSLFRAHLIDLRNTGAHVTACDIDPVVREHPCSDAQVVIAPDAPLPFADASFDVIVGYNVFEHLEDPDFAAAELLRVLRPGGYICARTPSRWGYVALASRLVPNRLHMAVLARAQPGRQAQDTFPTHYRLNSPGQLRRAFAGCDVMHFHCSAEPAYTFGSPLLYRAFLTLHRLLPGPLNTILCAFIRKPEGAAGRAPEPAAAPGADA